MGSNNLRAGVAILIIVAMLATVQLGEAAKKKCKAPMLVMKPCMPAVMGPTPPPPSPMCCDVVKKSDAKCLCDFKGCLLTPPKDPKDPKHAPKDPKDSHKDPKDPKDAPKEPRPAPKDPKHDPMAPKPVKINPKAVMDLAKKCGLVMPEPFKC